MCLEESVCPFTRDALNFWQEPKIYGAPHHPAVFRFALSLIRHHWTILHCSHLPLGWPTPVVCPS